MMHTMGKNNPNFSDVATGLELTTAVGNTILVYTIFLTI